MRSFLLVIIFFVIGFFLINNPSENLQPTEIKYVKIAGQIIKVDLASTPEAQMRGLSGRGELKENEGMLFIFDSPGRRPFWMKDMNFAIDIIWLAEDLKVVYIKKDALPELYPEIYSAEENARYVLEVVAGFSEKNNLKEGDRAWFAF